MSPKKKHGDNLGVGELRDGPRGGKLRNGGTNKGGTGRPPNEFMRHMRALVNRESVQAYLSECIEGKFGPKFHLSALQYASDRAYGKPSQSIVEYDFNPDDFSEAGLERVADGEDPVHVLSTGGRKLTEGR
jgi:hypothetical protein